LRLFYQAFHSGCGLRAIPQGDDRQKWMMVTHLRRGNRRLAGDDGLHEKNEEFPPG
jgi:hypothetical protein